MSIYGSQLWKFYRFSNVNTIYIAWTKAVRRIWTINSRTHNVLINKINSFAPIDVLLEKRCIKFVWTLFDSTCRYALYRRNVLLYKCNFTYHDWFSPIHVILK